MIHPNLGKRDLSQKMFYRVIMVTSLITTIVAGVVLWRVEHPSVANEEAKTAATRTP